MHTEIVISKGLVRSLVIPGLISLSPGPEAGMIHIAGSVPTAAVREDRCPEPRSS